MAAQHLHIWGRAAQATGDYMSLSRRCQEQDGQELREARAALIAELAALLEIAQQWIKSCLRRNRVFYVKATRNMIEACGIAQREIDDYLGTMGT